MHILLQILRVYDHAVVGMSAHVEHLAQHNGGEVVPEGPGDSGDDNPFGE